MELFRGDSGGEDEKRCPGCTGEANHYQHGRILTLHVQKSPYSGYCSIVPPDRQADGLAQSSLDTLSRQARSILLNYNLRTLSLREEPPRRSREDQQGELPNLQPSPAHRAYREHLFSTHPIESIPVSTNIPGPTPPTILQFHSTSGF